MAVALVAQCGSVGWMPSGTSADMSAAAIAGAVQGLTEFLPVSSDGHLALVSWLVPGGQLQLSDVVLLHGATLLATLVAFRSELALIMRKLHLEIRQRQPAEAVFLAERVVLASVPTAVIGLYLEPHIEAYSSIPWVVGLGFFFSGTLLLLTRKKQREADQHLPSRAGALLIGCAQGLAVLPGVSRSGSTIATAVLFGVPLLQAFRFSFLLSLPAIAGALLLESLKGEGLAFGEASVAVAATVAFAVGLLALGLLRRLVTTGRLWYFAMYLLPLAVACMVVVR